ncbi:MAG: nitroreductase family protein, partial [Proteobacteria bacterium]|nr:nitroreductase family protein [Pseudomonadota bacterium]
VFMDKEHSYHREKDLMAIGASIENILLYAYSLGIGTTWLGEILKNADKIRELCQLTERYELFCVIALGWIDKKPKPVGREDLSSLILKVI